MKKKILRGIGLLVVIVMILYSNGCTVVFGLIGSTEDRITPDIAATTPGWEVREVKPGSQIIVNLKDGTIVSGEYFGVDSIPNEEYATKYAEIQKQMPEGSFLPSIGDTIKVSSKLITQDSLKFSGFEYGYIKLSLLDSDKSGKLKIEDLENITDKHGNKIEGEAIRNMISEGKIASSFLSRIIVEEYKGEENKWKKEKVSTVGKKLIYINDIDHIQIKSNKDHTRNGIITGLLIDAVIITCTSIWVAKNWPSGY